MSLKLFDGEREYFPQNTSDMNQIIRESTAQAIDVYVDGKYQGTWFPKQETPT
jgi:hypothetical protein